MPAFDGSAGFATSAPISFSGNPLGSPGGGQLTFGAGPGNTEGPSVTDKIGGFLGSTMESFPELFGIEPSEATQIYRAQNPVGSVASQLVGAFVPYAAAAKGLRLIPWAAKAIEGAGALGKGAITTGALETAAETGMIEAGRIGLSATGLPASIYGQLTGTQPETTPIPDMVGQGVFNIAGGAVLGGALGGLAARFARGKNFTDITGVPNDAPLTQQIRAVDDILAQHADPESKVDLTPDAVARLERERQQRISYNLLDVMPQYTDTGDTIPGTMKKDLGKSYYSIIGDKKDKLAGFLNRLNSGWSGSSPDKLVRTRRFYLDESKGKVATYSNPDEYDADALAAGVTPDQLGTWAQDIKVLEVKEGNQGGPGKPKPKTAPTVDELLAGPVPEDTGIDLGDIPVDEGGDLAGGSRLLSSSPEWNKTRNPLVGRAKGLQRRFMSRAFLDVGDGWRMAQDETGFYVMAKKIGGTVDPAPGDKWMILRTDRPDKISPKASAMNDVLDQAGYFAKPEDFVNVPETLYQSGVNILRQTENPVQNALRRAKTDAGAMVRDMTETARTYVQPTGPLATRNKYFNQYLTLLRELRDRAEEAVVTRMKGAHIINPEARAGGILGLGNNAAENSFEGQIAKFAQKDLDDVQFVLEHELPIDKVREANSRMDTNGEPVISDKALGLLEALQVHDNHFVDQRIPALTDAVKTDAATNLLAQFQRRSGHYGITRDFTGGVQYYLHDAAGEVVGIAPGATDAEAQKAAQETIEKYRKRGKELRMGGSFQTSLMTPEDTARLRALINRPGFIRARVGILGYDLSRGPLDKKTLTDVISSNMRRRENFIRNVVAHDLGAPLLEKMQRFSPQDAIRADKARKIMEGDEGQFADVQNRIMDKVLAVAGLNGKNSASAIVRETQKIMSGFQFNWLNVSAPVTNLLGNFQTLLPQISYLMHASPETLARDYASLPLIDGLGNFKGTMGVLSEVKVMSDSFRMLGTKFKDQPQDYQELVENLTKMRVIAPRFAEANIGADGAILSEPLAALKSGQGFVNFLKSANVMMISKTEELARLMTVNAAYKLGKLAGMDSKRLAIFARDMVSRVNYNYSAMDRALVFTTPVGSLAGTFKNWLFHYMSNMLQFAGGGKETLAPLMWQTAATGLFAGAAGTPLVMPIANAASNFFTNQGFMQNLYDSAQNHGVPEQVADGIMYGLPGMLGVALGAQMASPGSDPQRDLQMMFSFAAFDRMKNLSAGLRDALVAYHATGASPWEDSRARGELLKGLAPRTIYRAMALTSDLGVKSLTTGYDVTHPMGLGSAILYGAGFSTTELEKTYDVYNKIKDDQTAQKALVKQMGANLADAVNSGDDRLANRIYARAIATGVDTGTLMRSLETRQQKQEATQLEQVASPEDQDKYQFMFDGG